MTKIDKLKIIKSYYPDAKMELNYTTPFQLLVAVMLSAQTTDKMVNRATEELFKTYKEAEDFTKFTYDELYEYIKIIGLAKTKTKHLIELSKIVKTKYDGKIINDRNELMKLPGVGQKTANLVISELYNGRYIAVDTHLERVTKRLAIVPEKATAKEVEYTLERLLKKEDLLQFHHSLIFFGRYHCKAKKPECNNCLLKNECRYYKKELKKNNYKINT